MDQVRLAKEELVCSICHEFFTLPKVLECQHSFCEDCLRKCYQHSRSKRPRKGSATIFACPECRHDCSLPQEGVQALPTNFKLARLVEILSPEQKLTIQNATRRSLRRRESNLHPHCADHPRKLLEYYCKDCHQLVCGSCMLSSHRSHAASIIEAEDALQQHVEVLNELKAQANTTLQGAENVMDNLAKDIEEIKTNGTRAAQRVKTYFCHLRDVLVKRERHFLSSLNSSLERPIVDITEQRKTVRKAMGDIIQNLKTLDQLSQQNGFNLLTEKAIVTEVNNNILAMQNVQEKIIGNPILTIVTMPCFEDQEFDKICRLVGDPSFRACPPDCTGKRSYNTDSRPSPALPPKVKPKAPEPPSVKPKAPEPPSVKVSSTPPPPLPPKSPSHTKQTDVIAPADNKNTPADGFNNTEDDTNKTTSVGSPPPLPPKSPRRTRAPLQPSLSGGSSPSEVLKRPIPVPRQKKTPHSPSLPRRARAITVAPNSDQSPGSVSPPPKDNLIIRSHTVGSSNKISLLSPPLSPSSPDSPLGLTSIVQPVMIITSKQLMGPAFSRQAKTDHVYPTGVCVGDNGIITVSDLKNHCVRMVTSSGKFLDYIGSEGCGEGQFREPSAVAMDKSGNILVTDRNCLTVQKFTNTGQFMSKVVPKGLRSTSLADPRGLAVTHDDRLLIADAEKLCIHVFDDTGKSLTQFGSNVDSSSSFLQPVGIAIDQRGRVLVTDRGNHMVWVYTPDGEYLNRFGFQGHGLGDLYFPCGIAVDSQGHIFVSESGNHRVSVFSNSGDYICCFGMKGSEPGMFQSPRYICVDKDDRLIVADECNFRLQVFNVKDILNEAHLL